MKKGVLLIGHGSRLPYNKRMLEFHAKLLRDSGIENVYIAFNEMNEPEIEDAMRGIAADGVTELVALPLFVASGQHVAFDIPAKLGIKDGYGTSISASTGKEILVHYESPFGDDPEVTNVLMNKIDDIGFDGSTGIMLIAHGSPKKNNSELTEMIAERLKEKYGNVFFGFNEYNEPSIEDTFGLIIKKGFEKVTVIPMFMASGAHLEEEIPEKLGIPIGSRGGIVMREGKEITVNYAEPYGMDPRMNNILIKKIKKYD